MNAALSRPQSQEAQSNDTSTPTPPSTPSGIFKRNVSEKRRPPVVPPGTVGSPTPKSDTTKVKLHNQAQFIHNDEAPTKQEKSENDQDFLAAKVKLRRVSNKE